MKFRVTFKTNDALDYVSILEGGEELSIEAREFAEKYVKYGEYITVEFDNEKETVKVLRN